MVLNGLSLIDSIFFGGAGDQRGTDVEIQGNQLYVSVNREELQAENASATLLNYQLPTSPGAGPRFSRPWNFGVLNGIATTEGEVVAGGFSHPDAGLTLDGVGTTEVKSLLVKFDGNNQSGGGPGGSDWAAKVPDGLFNDNPGNAFFYYTGVENFTDVAILGDFAYAVGHAQPFSHTTHVIAKYDSSGNIIDAKTATEGIHFNMGSGPIPAGAKGAMYAVMELDGYLYAAGGKQDGNGVESPTVWKYDSNLALQWQMQFPISDSIGKFNGLATDGVSIFAVGESGDTEKDFFAAKLDQDGQAIWQGSHDNGGAVESLRDVVVVDGRLFTVGVGGSVDDTDMAIAELDPADGEQISSDVFGGFFDDAANRIAAYGSDLYVIGESRSFAVDGNAQGENDALLLHVRTFNTKPEITSLTLADATITENEAAKLQGAFVDPDQLDDFSLTVNWSDPNNPLPSVFELGTAMDLTVNAIFNSTTAGDGSTVLKIIDIDPDTDQYSFEVSRIFEDDGAAPGNGTAFDASLIEVVVADDAGGSDASVSAPSGTLFEAAFALGGAGRDEVHDTELDDHGAFVTGQFSGTVEFDNVDDSMELTSIGNADLFVAKYNEDGSPIWVRQIGGPNAEANGLELAADGLGNVYVAAIFTNTVDFDPGPNTKHLTSTGSLFEAANAAIVKLDRDGNMVWVRHINGPRSHALSIDIDSNGNLYVGGWLWGTADFDTDNIAAGDTIVSAGSQDGFLAKYSPDGQFQWARGVGAALQDDGQGVAIDSSNNVYLSGFFRGQVDFDRTAISPGDTTSSLGSSDSFLLKLDSGGAFQWVRSWGGTLDDTNIRDAARAVAVDANDNVYTTGAFDVAQGPVDFDQTASHANNTDILGGVGLMDAFILKHDSAGNFHWVRGVGGSSTDGGADISVDHDGMVYVVGENRSSDFDVNPDPQAITTQATAGMADGFLLTLDANGQSVFAGQLGGSGDDFARSVAVATDFNVVVSGFFDSSLGDFDPTSGNSTLGANGESDGFVTVLELAAPSPILTVVNANPVAADQSYTTDEDAPLILPSLLSGNDDNGSFSLTDPGPLDQHFVVANAATQQGGSIEFTPNGSVTYQPRLNFFGIDTFEYTARDDDGGADVGVVTITVNPENDPPTLDPIPAPPAIQPGVGEQSIQLTGISDGGGENQDIRVIASSSDESIIATPVIDYVSAQAGATLRYSPTGNSLGEVTITVTVIDAGLDNDLNETADNGTFSRQIIVDVREFPWTNVNDIYDTNADQSINVIDAFTVIDGLRNRGVGADLPSVGPSPDSGPFIDINSNNRIDLQDAFLVINKVRDIFNGNGEGELRLVPRSSTSTLDWAGIAPWRQFNERAFADGDWFDRLDAFWRVDEPSLGSDLDGWPKKKFHS